MNDFESLVGKTIKVVSMGEATEQDRHSWAHIDWKRSSLLYATSPVLQILTLYA